MKKQRGITELLWVAVTLLGANAATAQPATNSATVVFYSHGNLWTSGLPGSNHGIFYGRVFCGENALFSFREGVFAKNNLVISFHVPPGEYAFSASYGKHAPQKRIPLTLNPGQRYFFRAQSESRGIVEIEWERGRLDQVSCETASEETKSAKQLAAKKVAKQFAAIIDSTQIPITCP
jgi:hypothetical protein